MKITVKYIKSLILFLLLLFLLGCCLIVFLCRVIESQNKIMPNLPNIPTIEDLCNASGTINVEKSIITNISHFGYIGGEIYFPKPNDKTGFCPVFEVSVFNQATFHGYNWISNWPLIESENIKIENVDTMIDYFGIESGTAFYRFNFSFQDYNVYVWDFDQLSVNIDGKVCQTEKERIYKNIEFFIKSLIDANSTI